ncbi:nucleotidyl transferase AbiEii/AbiGii toxin family protein [Conservatibacter flavescens]|uniref:Nucleotidyl transferase AbiEii/AbiGii toxin family protein n=1 Tax=Conservatibacter flavescens TaxID=28161 RepID=A0A2M8RZV2_9PAST|nr:nucleotidyl transferase AbiEii/AbiGii toxin family protein [Conservatibacter flavescens]PJG84431.1 hypothetical protein CVP05_11310 [Conservatibacter flavescens]
MNLHENDQLFREAIVYTAEKLDISPIYIEKDYWVTLILHTIFSNSDVAHSTVFKGGTSLLKCYNYIQRFSEDIDLVILKDSYETDNQLKNKLKKITRLASDKLQEHEIPQITNKKGNIRKTAHIYLHLFDGNYEQVREHIILEATWLGYFEPYTKRPIISFIGQILLDNGQEKLAEEYDLLPFEVNVLEPIRTLCEKIMSLVRFSYTPRYIEDLNLKVRHIYDIHQLLSSPKIMSFFESEDFESMLLKVANDDMLSFKNNNKWLKHHPADSFMFKDIQDSWAAIKNTYQTIFKHIVFGELPNNEIILQTLQNVSDRLRKINWEIHSLIQE